MEVQLVPSSREKDDNDDQWAALFRMQKRRVTWQLQYLHITLLTLISIVLNSNKASCILQYAIVNSLRQEFTNSFSPHVFHLHFGLQNVRTGLIFYLVMNGYKSDHPT